MISELDLELCEPVAVLPTQISGGMRWDAETSGPRALMLAVLKDAVRCIEQGRRRGHFHARRLAAEAAAWVRSDDRTYPFSFLNITDVLGIDADAVRDRLLRVSRTTCPEVRARVVTERSPKAVFRHTDIHGPPPRDRLGSSAIRVPQRNINHRRESVMKQKSNKWIGLVGVVLTTLCASPALADVRWKHMVGVITATDNPATAALENFNDVGNVNAATFAWSVRDGHARVDLDTGNTDFEVHGLVIIGTIFSGTAGPVNAVTGTLVCNPGDQTAEVELDTSDVSIDSQGNARFSGTIPGIPAICASPVFLVRIATIANPANPNGARGFWIGTGTERSTRQN